MRAPARVLLVEDDDSVSRFVALAVDDMPVSLIRCRCVADAVKTLEEAPVRLLLTDLMLPGESGLSLLVRLRDNPQLRGDALIAVFSAGLGAQMRQELAAFPVWRLLSKPVPLGTLRQCIDDALAGGAEEAVSPPQEAAGTLSADDSSAVQTYFGGDAELFMAYRKSCEQQFPLDIRAGDAAMLSADLGALRRLAHSLASVQLTLGKTLQSEHAKALELSAEAGDVHASQRHWALVRSALMP